MILRCAPILLSSWRGVNHQHQSRGYNETIRRAKQEAGHASKPGALLAVLLLCLFLAGCLSMHAPLGPAPGRLEIKAAGKVDQKAMIGQAVFEQVGPLMDQPSPDHWLGPPTWQVSAYMLGEAKAIWPLEPLAGLASAPAGPERPGAAIFAAPSGAHRYRLTWACTVTHFWSEGMAPGRSRWGCICASKR